MIIISEDDGTVLAIHDVDVAAIVQEVRRKQLRHGDIRAAWDLLEQADEATSAVKDEILAAIAREEKKA